MLPLVAFPRTYVDIYPFEGGSFFIDGGSDALLACTVDTDVRQGYGAFSLQLAPGGPHGPNASPQWTDVITPMSLVVISMQRSGSARVVMIGVVKSVTESELWSPTNVQRGIVVQGYDFGYFFLQDNYYTLSLLNATLGAPLGVSGALTSVDQGLVFGSPATVGTAWYNDIMAGPNSIMADTTFAYQGGRVKFYDMVATLFQEYEANIRIPIGDNFMSSDGTWMDKFRELFPFPWYEFFITTAPIGAYPGTPARSTILSSRRGYPPACAQLVARMAPFPTVVNKGTNGNLNLQMDFSKWDALPIYELDGDMGYISKMLSNSENEMRNFYMVNPKWVSNLIGMTNDQQTPFTWLFASWIDVASIHRYGYRPEITELHWFVDSDGLSAKQNAASGVGQADFQTLVANLTLKKTSWHEPSVIMTEGSIVTNLRPDILAGNRFVCPIHKDNVPWEFYIEGISHNYRFGSSSTTELRLSRGLPVAVYDDENLMLAMHTGNVQKINGQYQVGLPQGLGAPLQPLNYSNMTATIGQVAKVFTIAQAK